MSPYEVLSNVQILFLILVLVNLINSAGRCIGSQMMVEAIYFLLGHFKTKSQSDNVAFESFLS